MRNLEGFMVPGEEKVVHSWWWLPTFRDGSRKDTMTKSFLVACFPRTLLAPGRASQGQPRPTSSPRPDKAIKCSWEHIPCHRISWPQASLGFVLHAPLVGILAWPSVVVPFLDLYVWPHKRCCYQTKPGNCCQGSIVTHGVARRRQQVLPDMPINCDLEKQETMWLVSRICCRNCMIMFLHMAKQIQTFAAELLQSEVPSLGPRNMV